MNIYFHSSSIIATNTKFQTINRCEWELVIENEKYPETQLGVFFKTFVTKPTKRQIRKAKREAREDFEKAYVDFLEYCNHL